jgi:hypothetical protein
MKIRAYLAIALLWLAPPIFGDTFYKTAREARALEEKGVPIPQQAMEMTAGLIWSLTVELTDGSGKRLGSGLLGTFYDMWDSVKKETGVATYVLAPESVLGKATRVTVTCRVTSYHVAPLTIELRAEGNARNVFPGNGESQGLVAILLPQDFRETGYNLNELSRAGDALKPGAGTQVWFPLRENEAAKEGVATVTGLERTALLRPTNGGKDTWAVSVAYRQQAAGRPAFIVEEKLQYAVVGGQNWLHAYPIELAGIIVRPGEELALKDAGSASSLISQPAIAAIAVALHRQLERSGWAFLH